MSAASFPRFDDPKLAFVTPQLAQLLRLWNKKRGGRAMPARGDIDFRDFAAMAGNVGILEIVREGAAGLRYRVRVMGSKLETYVAPMTGKFIDQALAAPISDKWHAMFAASAEAGVAQRWIGQVQAEQKHYFLFEKLVAPLGNGGAQASYLLISTYYHPYGALHPHGGGDKPAREIADRLTGEFEAALKYKS